MGNVDALIFVDANQYLDLYRTASGKRLLAALKEQQNHIFMTAQVAEEVQRRKVEVTAAFLAEQFKELKLRNFGVPDHLFGTTGDRVRRIRGQLQEIHDKIKAANEELMKLAHDILDQITQSEDEVSIALAGIFAKAVPHNEGELQRAKVRKERGNAPGKKADPLGDQLSREQILSQCQHKSRLWIIIRDGDYTTEYGGKAFLNAALYQDLAKLLERAPEVFCFNNIPDGIKHFAETTQVGAEELPTPEEAEQIKKEQDSLPALGWLSSRMNDAASATILNWKQLRDAAFVSAVSTMINQGWHPGMAPDPDPPSGTQR